MRVLDLFSGIGGFSLGLERAGFETVAFCEIDPFCRRVLRKHWPKVRLYSDVRGIDAAQLNKDGIAPEVICGGFPCQDISVAGKNAGIRGSRSGLWFHYARIIGEVRPKYVFIENVAALLNRGLDQVLCSLAALGYDAEWECIPASAVGMPHNRDRVWIIAYSRKERVQGGFYSALQGLSRVPWRENVRRAQEQAHRFKVSTGGLCRVSDGIPGNVDRIMSLGNSLVPLIPELLGRSVLEFDARRNDQQS